MRVAIIELAVIVKLDNGDCHSVVLTDEGRDATIKFLEKLHGGVLKVDAVPLAGFDIVRSEEEAGHE